MRWITANHKANLRNMSKKDRGACKAYRRHVARNTRDRVSWDHLLYMQGVQIKNPLSGSLVNGCDPYDLPDD